MVRTSWINAVVGLSAFVIVGVVPVSRVSVGRDVLAPVVVRDRQ
jgi:hypothetical protein